MLLQISDPFRESWYLNKVRLCSTALRQDRQLQQHVQQILGACQLEAISAEGPMSQLVRLLVLTFVKKGVMLVEVILPHPRVHIFLPVVVPIDPTRG